MIEVKRRGSRVERCRDGAYKVCRIWPAIAAAVAPAVVGGILGGIGSKQTADAQRETNEEALKYQGLPRWAPEQMPYVFGGAGGLGKQFDIPGMNSAAINYASSAMGGSNPMYGPQDPSMYGGNMMQGLLASLGGQQGQQNPWFMNPSNNPFAQGQMGGLMGMLGFGAGAPPPLYANDPRLGAGVQDPQGLMGVLPGQTDGGATGGLLGAPPAPVQAPQQPQGPQLPQGVDPYRQVFDPQQPSSMLGYDMGRNGFGGRAYYDPVTRRVGDTYWRDIINSGG